MRVQTRVTSLFINAVAEEAKNSQHALSWFQHDLCEPEVDGFLYCCVAFIWLLNAKKVLGWPKYHSVTRGRSGFVIYPDNFLLTAQLQSCGV